MHGEEAQRPLLGLKVLLMIPRTAIGQLKALLRTATTGSGALTGLEGKTTTNRPTLVFGKLLLTPLGLTSSGT